MKRTCIIITSTLCGVLFAGTILGNAPLPGPNATPPFPDPNANPQLPGPNGNPPRPGPNANLPRPGSNGNPQRPGPNGNMQLPRLAQPPRPLDLNAMLIPPELVQRFAPQVGIPPEVVQSIRAMAQENRPKIDESQQKLRADMEALNNLMKQPKPDAAACLDQLDKILADERGIKRTHLEAAVAIRNKLTPEQVMQLMQMRERMTVNENGAPESLRVKMQQVQSLAQQRQQEGRDLSQVRPLMQQARNAVEEGRYRDADMTLDRIFNILK